MRSRRMGLRVRNDGSTAAPQNPDVVRITGIRDYVDMHTALRLYFADRAQGTFPVRMLDIVREGGVPGRYSVRRIS